MGKSTFKRVETRPMPTKKETAKKGGAKPEPVYGTPEWHKARGYEYFYGGYWHREPEYKPTEPSPIFRKEEAKVIPSVEIQQPISKPEGVKQELKVIPQVTSKVSALEKAKMIIQAPSKWRVGLATGISKVTQKLLRSEEAKLEKEAKQLESLQGKISEEEYEKKVKSFEKKIETYEQRRWTPKEAIKRGAYGIIETPFTISEIATGGVSYGISKGKEFVTGIGGLIKGKEYKKLGLIGLEMGTTAVITGGIFKGYAKVTTPKVIRVGTKSFSQEIRYPTISEFKTGAISKVFKTGAISKVEYKAGLFRRTKYQDVLTKGITISKRGKGGLTLTRGDYISKLAKGKKEFKIKTIGITKQEKPLFRGISLGRKIGEKKGVASAFFGKDIIKTPSETLTATFGKTKIYKGRKISKPYVEFGLHRTRLLQTPIETETFFRTGLRTKPTQIKGIGEVLSKTAKKTFEKSFIKPPSPKVGLGLGMGLGMGLGLRTQKRISLMKQIYAPSIAEKTTTKLITKPITKMKQKIGMGLINIPKLKSETISLTIPKQIQPTLTKSLQKEMTLTRSLTLAKPQVLQKSATRLLIAPSLYVPPTFISGRYPLAFPLPSISGERKKGKGEFYLPASQLYKYKPSLLGIFLGKRGKKKKLEKRMWTGLEIRPIAIK